MNDVHVMKFRGHEFMVREGKVHPAYSLDCFRADESEFREKYWHPKAGETVIDVGASYGAYALTAMACGANVVAFEPEPTVFVDLKANNDLNGGKMVLVCAGLGAEYGIKDMREYAPHWPAQTVSAPYVLAPLDAFATDLVDWIKIDVEGLEAEVLQGAKNTILFQKPTIIVECHTFMDKELTNKCRDIIRNSGTDDYDFEVVDRSPCEMLIARPR